MSREVVTTFFLFWYLQLSDEGKIYPVEIDKIHEFQVNISDCTDFNTLVVICNDVAYCVIKQFSQARCNKTENGVQVWIPLKLKCDIMEIKCEQLFLFSRTLLNYKVPTEVMSTYNLTDDHLIVYSKAIGIYPGGVCKFQIIDQNNTEVIVSSFNASTEYKGDLFDVICNFSVTTATLYNGYYNVNISVYSSTLSVEYGRNDSIRIFIGNESAPCCFQAKEAILIASSISGTVLLFVFTCVCVVTIYKQRLRKHRQFTGTFSRGDLTDVSNPFNTVESHSLSAHLEMTNVQSCHYVNHVNPDHLGNQSHYYSQVQLPGSLRQTSDPPVSCKIVETLDIQHISGVNDGYLTPLDVVTQNISGMNDNYITPLDVGTPTTDTTYQNVQPASGYVTIIDHYSTID